MLSADSTAAEPGARGVVLDAVARVLGVQGVHLRPDTPLSPLGWDSLARVCLEDALAEAGVTCGTLGSAETIGDVMDGCPALTSGRPT